MKHFWIVAALLSLTACASGYKPANSGGTIMGYEEARVKPGVYRLKYQGKHGQAGPQIYQWFLLRGAELTKADGKKYFKVEDGRSGETTRGGGMMASVGFPHYEGNIVTVDALDKDSFDADELIKNTPRQ